LYPTGNGKVIVAHHISFWRWLRSRQSSWRKQHESKHLAKCGFCTRLGELQHQISKEQPLQIHICHHKAWLRGCATQKPSNLGQQPLC